MRERLIKKITAVNYDGITKQLLDNMNDSTMIQFINSTFERNFSIDSDVVRLAAETTDNETKQKRCDYFVKIGDDFFLIEIQSYEDEEMAIRIFEYGSRGAILHAREKTDGSTIELQFPEPVVFYLRKEGTIHDKLAVKIRRTGSEETFDYEAKVIYVEDYDFDSLIEKSMLPMIPFYPMRYEKMLKRKHSNQDEKDMLKDLSVCYEKLKEALTAKKFGYIYFQYMSASMANVFKGMIKRMKNQGNILNEEEANRVMQKMIDEPIEMFDIFSALEQSKEEGEEIGQKRGEEIGQKRGEEIGQKRGEEIGQKRGEEIGQKRGEEIGQKRGEEIGQKRGEEIGQKRGEQIGESRGREQCTKVMKYLMKKYTPGKTEEEIICELTAEFNISTEDAQEYLRSFQED